MANGNSAQGLIPRRLRNGNPWDGPLRTYHVPSSNATALYVGDPVIISGTGSTNGYPDCVAATAGATNRITGVVVGFVPSAPFAPYKYLPASTDGYVLVADDPNILFEIQEDSVGGALAVTNIGQNCDLIAAAGSAYTGYSGWMLDSSTAATGATLQVRIIELQHRADNDIGTNAKWLVAINLPTETGAAGSLGV
jgi:hypothetical protein